MADPDAPNWQFLDLSLHGKDITPDDPKRIELLAACRWGEPPEELQYEFADAAASHAVTIMVQGYGIKDDEYNDNEMYDLEAVDWEGFPEQYVILPAKRAAKWADEWMTQLRGRAKARVGTAVDRGRAIEIAREWAQNHGEAMVVVDCGDGEFIHRENVRHT